MLTANHFKCSGMRSAQNTKVRRGSPFNRIASYYLCCDALSNNYSQSKNR